MPTLSSELEQFFFDQDRWLTGEADDPTTAPAPPLDPPQPDQRRKVTLSDLLDLAGERTFGFLFVLLAFPSALPIPAPGYSVPFGIAMLLLAMQLLLGREEPWFPVSWRKHGFEVGQVRRVLKLGLPWLRRIESISRPRLTPVCTSVVGRTVIGLAIALMSISMMIPIPGTNTLPAMGIFVTGFGLLDDDGAISLGGLVLCVCGFVLSSSILLAIVFGGTSLVDIVKEALGR
ncbi:exopolysaccharide biosynthesis protein [Synechococcus sp. Cruz-9H2]|uniref:exopolysaccharide biosynthesis protein n=1 Tax=unclassified Synechococcus TaxID=2626047 RepID=UPI0020CEE25D|nr:MULTISPECIES: exopolysaccharide biosynthesis protein [unclassified Synechococcus]MCP9819573.1 exopolysaccharide biosynthesis protein [Synechococcus sp. Cruz-9H2]MCP9843877.1 exopolysaccharide biosynthesis protein [Synechococcus sp. Edmonson 11F2]MCP9855765.1 exopolysaccharide biosynthesis protein [Synechococcus sp. Cruz-9C9]MCP9863287.1 exopolysaccharide biosynthesis protein [Synechococcus sp. Cruz-7E5]MCP9870400.1 exopolysaccharide biosynthesis protein [Synechococcus sp. Cruz-7B9]